jgi:hypothetical protein
MIGKDLTDEQLDKTMDKQKVMLLKNCIIDTAYRNEVVSNAHYKKGDWKQLKLWMLSRWESQDTSIKESDLRELLKYGLTAEDFVSKFSTMVSEIHEMDMPQGRVLTDLFTRGIGKDHTLTIMAEMSKRDNASNGDTPKYLKSGYPVSWEKCKEILDALGFYHSQGLPVLNEGPAPSSRNEDKGIEKLITQMEQLSVKLAKMKAGKEVSKGKLCLFCDGSECVGAMNKRDCPVLKPYVERGLVKFTEIGHFADKEGKLFQLTVRRGC